jgi:2-polyprenyl-3-methyl-5-hydroxy-6-metoxy-1,4-benzoquinol methylase
MDLCELEFNPNWNSKRHPWERARVKVVMNMLKPIIRNKSGEVNILDIGSGDAYMVHRLVSENPNLVAHCVDIEYTDKIVDSLNSQVESKRIKFYKSLEDYKEANGDLIVDIALFLDVIEHVEDDVALLKLVTELSNVNSSSTILITVPAYQSLFSAHDVFLKHFRRYTVKSLHASTRKAGCDTEKTGYFFFSLYLARRLQKIFSGNKEDSQKGISAYKPIFLMDQIFLTILVLDFHLFKGLSSLGLKFPGLSCYAICQTEQE